MDLGKLFLSRSLLKLKSNLLKFPFSSNRSSFRVELKSFSLIELMVVVTIIAIVSAIAVTNYSSYVNKARFVSIINTLEPCIDHVYQFVIKNGVLPTGGDGQKVNCYGKDLVASTTSLQPRITQPPTHLINENVYGIYRCFTMSSNQTNCINAGLVVINSAKPSYPLIIKLSLNSNTGELTKTCAKCSNNIPNNNVPAECNTIQECW